MTTDKKNDKAPPWRAALRFSAQLGVVLAVCALPALSQEQRRAVAQALRDPLSVLSDRSPGARDSAKLRQTKVKHALASPAQIEKALSNTAMIPPADLKQPQGPFESASEPDTALAFMPDEPIGDVVSPASYSPEVGIAPRSPFFPGGGGGGIIGGGGGGGGGDNGGSAGCKEGENCGTPNNPAIPIPEPSTWASMIAGFMLLGGLLRGARTYRVRLFRSNATRAA